MIPLQSPSKTLRIPSRAKQPLRSNILNLVIIVKHTNVKTETSTRSTSPEGTPYLAQCAYERRMLRKRSKKKKIPNTFGIQEPGIYIYMKKERKTSRTKTIGTYA